MDGRSKGLERPFAKATAEELEDEDLHCPVAPAEARELRALAARGNYLAMDQPDAQFAVEEACRDMAAPSQASWANFKRVARLSLEFSRLVWRFGGGPDDLETIQAYADSDWTRCLRARRSTTAGWWRLGERLSSTGVPLKRRWPCRRGRPQSHRWRRPPPRASGCRRRRRIWGCI